MSTETNLLVLLQQARQSGQPIPELPRGARPSDLATAYSIAARLADRQGALAGWKIGATSTRGQAMLGLSEPFFGRIFADTVLHHPQRAFASNRLLAIEPEIAFFIRRDLPRRDQPSTPDEVADAIEAVAPAFEINRPSFARPFEAGGLALIADNGVNAGACVGQPRTDWRSIDLSNIAVIVTPEGQPTINGSSSVVLGHPLVAVCWLANTLPLWGEQLRAGQIVLSGAMTAPIELAAGGTISAMFAELGGIELAVTAKSARPSESKLCLSSENALAGAQLPADNAGAPAQE